MHAVEREWSAAGLPACDTTGVRVTVPDYVRFTQRCRAEPFGQCTRFRCSYGCLSADDYRVIVVAPLAPSHAHVVAHEAVHFCAWSVLGDPDAAHSSARLWQGHGPNESSVEGRAKLSL